MRCLNCQAFLLKGYNFNVEGNLAFTLKNFVNEYHKRPSCEGCILKGPIPSIKKWR